jgi:toluene monooxygenase system protein A
MDWAFKAYDTNEWAMIAARHFFDDIMMTRDAISVSIMLTFSFETGFTNMQFLGLAADAAEAGDHTFANLISSIQTDESRHAQIGGPALKVLIENGHKAEAQKRVDIAVWGLEAVLGAHRSDHGLLHPLEHRKQSFKEFMEEWIVAQFERAHRHGPGPALVLGHLPQRHRPDPPRHAPGLLLLAPDPVVEPGRRRHPRRARLAGREVPRLERHRGQCWDVFIDNVVDGNMAKTYPETLPYVCNMCQLPILGVPGKGWNVKDYPGVQGPSTTSAPRSIAGSSSRSPSATPATCPSWIASWPG